MQLRVGSLFSGGGLGDLGFMMADCEIVFQVEIDEYCQKILNLRWPNVPKWKDIRAVKGSELPKCDIITGGFPCQPFSVAGKQMGEKDDRHLWPEMFRIISEVRPAWVVGENVSGFINMGLDPVLSDLEGIGYETTTFVFPAHALGAPHRRERVWIVTYTGHNVRAAIQEPKDNGSASKNSTQGQSRGEQSSGPGSCKRGDKDVANTTDSRAQGMRERSKPANKVISNTGLLGQAIDEEQTAGSKQLREDVADSSSGRHESQKNEIQARGNSFKYRSWWETEPDVGRVVDGCPARVDRLKCLGNGQVAACTAFIAEQITEFERISHGKRLQRR